MAAEECLEDIEWAEASDAYGDPGIGVNCTLMIFWRFEGILCGVCSPEEDIDRRDDCLIIEDPLNSVVSYQEYCNINNITCKSQKRHAHLIVTCSGYQFREIVKSCS